MQLFSDRLDRNEKTIVFGTRHHFQWRIRINLILCDKEKTF